MKGNDPSDPAVKMLSALVLEEGDRFKQHKIILAYEKTKPTELVYFLNTLGVRVISVGIEFKESIRGHENDLIEEFPKLDYLRQLASNDPSKLQDYKLSTIYKYSDYHYFDFLSSDGCKSSFVPGYDVTD